MSFWLAVAVWIVTYAIGVAHGIRLHRDEIEPARKARRAAKKAREKGWDVS